MVSSNMARGAAAAFTLFYYAGLTSAAHLQYARRAEVVDVMTRFNGCDALARAGLGGVLYYPQDSEYSGTITSYYSADVQDVKPTCILKPTTTEQVSKTIKVLNSREGRDWPVAIRGGGHAPYPSNNAKDGVTIDLGRLNAITFKSCKHGSAYGTASIGAGARWGEVYAKLEPQGIMVSGGREGHVGVGGFLLGGGFTWYSGKRGMAADDVVAYEVVLSDGSIVRASATKNSDLFKSLKGGLNNLGVVTKFEVRTFPAQNLFGGVMAFPWTQKEAVVQKFINMIDNNRANPAETGFISLSWSPASPVGSTVAFITANVDGVANSTSFQGLENLTPMVDYRMPMPLTGLTTQLASTLGLYNVWYTLTVHNTIDMGRKVISVFEALVAELTSQIIDEPIQLIFVMTPLPKTYGEHGANILGLDKMARNSIVLQPEVILPTKRYQALLQGKLKAAVAAIETYAKRTGQDTPWRYINYANPEQNPLASYGQDNVNFLQKTVRKYDSSGYFQGRAVAGEFKISSVA